MEVVFILGVVTFIIVQLVSKAFNSTTNAGNTVPPVNRHITIEEYAKSPAFDSENEGNYLDIPVKSKVKTKKEKSNANSLNASSTKENTSVKENQKPKQIVTLNNISEAKRAFLYSEIFNRKY